MSIESFYYPKLATLPDSWKRGSFAGIGALWIVSNNSLTPSDYKIRKIKDLGSIKTSIINSDIDLFNRELKIVDGNNELLTEIKSSVAALGVFIFAAPLGCVWHLGNSIYHTVLWIRGEKQTHLKEHILSLIQDLGWTAPSCASAYIILKTEKFF
jgi:hypothetical protein